MIWNMRIKHLREQNKLTLKEIASKLGCSEATAQRYENNNGIKNIPYEVILKFAEIFDVSPAYIMGWDDNITPVSLGQYKIPVVATVAAGEPIYSEEHVLEYIDWDKDPHGNIFGLKIQGDSMTPRIQNGDTIIVDREAAYSDGDIIVATVNGNEGTCKRLKLYAEGLALVSLNPKYEPMYFSKEQVEELPVRIIGKVIENRQKF